MNSVRSLKFDSNSTLLIKGIAIILMICNHLYPIFEWIYPENMYLSFPLGDKNLAAYIGGFSKICVSIFALLTGIGMYYCYKKKGIKIGYVYNLRKLLKFFLTYWIVLGLVYIPVMISVSIYKFDLLECILNMFGYKTTYCRIAWYVRFYMELVLTFPIFLYVKILLERSHNRIISSLNPILIIIIPILINILIDLSNLDGNIVFYVKEYFGYISIVLAGYFIAEYALFERVYNKIITLNIKIIYCSCLIGFIICFLGRGFLTRIEWVNTDLIFAPGFIFLFWTLNNVIRNDVLSDILITLGKYSLEIWFLHAIFFVGNVKVQRVAYWPKIDILILIWVVFLCLMVAFVIRKIEAQIIKKINW